MLFYIWAYFRVTGQQVYFFARRSLEPWNMLLCPDNMLRDPSIQSADLCLVYVMWYSTASSLRTYFSFFMLLFVFGGHTYSLEDVVSTSMSSFLTSCSLSWPMNFSLHIPYGDILWGCQANTGFYMSTWFFEGVRPFTLLSPQAYRSHRSCGDYPCSLYSAYSHF